MFLILYSEFVMATALLCLYNYRDILFTNLFSLVCTAVVIAFIPNFLTSLLLHSHTISDVNSQIAFGITGSIVLIFLYKVLSKYNVT